MEEVKGEGVMWVHSVYFRGARVSSMGGGGRAYSLNPLTWKRVWVGVDVIERHNHGRLHLNTAGPCPGVRRQVRQVKRGGSGCGGAGVQEDEEIHVDDRGGEDAAPHAGSRGRNAGAAVTRERP